MYHRKNVTLNLPALNLFHGFQDLLAKRLIIKSHEMLKEVQHDVRIKDMT